MSLYVSPNFAEANRNRYIKNKEKIIARSAVWAKENKEKVLLAAKKYRDNNKEKANKAVLNWVSNNRDKSNFYASNRRAVKRNATVAWANKFILKEAYNLAKLREKLCGGIWHVDHIVPLKSDIVCGLHTHDNIQVIPAIVNLVKNNRYWPNMP